MDIVITLFLAPALAIYFIVLGAILVLALVLSWMLELEKKSKK